MLALLAAAHGLTFGSATARRSRSLATMMGKAEREAERDDALLSQMYGVRSSQTGAAKQDQTIRTIADLQRRAAGTSAIMQADERLSAAVEGMADAKDQRAAVQQLRLECDAARAAGVREDDMMMQKAISLLGLMESATQEATKPADPAASKMDAIFGGGYAVPGLEDLDDDDAAW